MEKLKICAVEQSGHNNRTFHLGNNMTVCLPSRPEYVAKLKKEAKWLPFLQERMKNILEE